MHCLVTRWIDSGPKCPSSVVQITKYNSVLNILQNLSCHINQKLSFSIFHQTPDTGVSVCLFYRTSKKPFSQYREILFICNLPTLLLRTKKFDYQQRNGLIKKETKRTKKIIHSDDRCSFITDMMHTYTMKWEWHWQWLEVPCYHWQIDRR